MGKNISLLLFVLLVVSMPCFDLVSHAEAASESFWLYSGDCQLCPSDKFDCSKEVSRYKIPQPGYSVLELSYNPVESPAESEFVVKYKSVVFDTNSFLMSVRSVVLIV